MMVSGKQLQWGSYLCDVLVDGARVFLFRTRLRRLLGVDMGEKTTMFPSPRVPPVGFKYANLPLDPNSLGFPDTDQGAWNEPEQRGENPSNSLSTDQLSVALAMKSNLDGRSNDPAFKDNGKVGSEKAGRERSSKFGKGDYSKSGAKGPQKRKLPVEQIPIKIPGISAQPTPPPQLSPKPHAIPQMDNESVSDDEEISPLEKSNPKPERQSPKPMETTLGSRMPTLDLYPGNTKQQGAERDQQSLTGAEDGRNARKSPVSPPKDIAGNIALLQRSLPKITHSGAAQRQKTKTERVPPDGQPPRPAPARQVFIVRSAASRPARPHAFWERSYLGRLHFRVFR